MDLSAGDEIRLLSGEWVRLVADPRQSVADRYVLEYESLERLPNGMVTKSGVIVLGSGETMSPAAESTEDTGLPQAA